MLTIDTVVLQMLVAHQVKKKFGGLVAVQDVDLTLKEGEILGLVGPNGAGKTTLLNIISGLYQPDNGTIHYKGENITGLSLNKLCKKGISKTFQHPQSFPGMLAAEAVMVSAIFGNHHKVGMKDAREEAIGHLEFVGFPKDNIDAPLSQAQPHGIEAYSARPVPLPQGQNSSSWTNSPPGSTRTRAGKQSA